MRSADLVQTADFVWLVAQHCALAIGAVGLIFAVAEYAVARSAWLRRLRMSFEERKRELKEEEGDALARGRRRSLHRALLKGGIGRVADAAFVVVNPTQLAVALAYRPPCIPVPEVLVRASDAAAARVRAIALDTPNSRDRECRPSTRPLSRWANGRTYSTRAPRSRSRGGCGTPSQ